jgi:hypothetical protein
MVMSRARAEQLADDTRMIVGQLEELADLLDEVADEDNETRRDALDSLPDVLNDALTQARDIVATFEKEWEKV